MRELRARVSGLCVPQYVLDIPGGHGKAPLNSSDVEKSQPAIACAIMRAAGINIRRTLERRQAA